MIHILNKVKIFLFPMFVLAVALFTQMGRVSTGSVQGIVNIWDFDTPADYVFDNTKIRLEDGKASLKAPDDWYDGDWLYRKKIVIDNTKVADNLTNFPVLVNFATDSDLSSSAQNDGDDILFTLSDGVSKLDHEIEHFSGDTGALTSWVNIPELDDETDTEFYLYYGNALASNQQNEEEVWDSNFGSVMHMSDQLTTPVVKFGYVNDVEYGDFDSVGDEHYKDSDERLVDFVEEMNTNYQPDFVISNSDYVQGHTSEAATISDLQYLESIFGELTMPRYYALGNHELSHLSKAQFIEHTAMEEEYYSFDVNGWHFVVLDYTYNPNGTPYDHNNFNWTEAIIPQAQLDWLEDDLSQTTLPVVVFVGKDLGASANGVNLMGVSVDSVTINNAPEVRAVLEESEKVKLVMVPEAGVNAHNKINNIHYIMGYGFNQGAYTGTNLHYSKVELYANGAIEILGEGSQFSYQIPIEESSSNKNIGNFFARDGENKSVTGKIGNAIDIDGVDDMVIIGNTESLEITEAITLESWVNIDVYNQTVNTNGVIISKRPNISNSVVDPFRLYALLLNGTTGRPRFSLATNTAGSAISLNADNAVPLSTWVHLAATYDGTTMKIYQNGSLVKQGTGFSGNLGTSAADITLGRYNTNTTYTNDRLNGRLDEVRISNLDRSAEWIATSYNNQNSPGSFYSLEAEEEPFVTDNPTIVPLAETAIEFTTISGFEEVATKNGGEIKYQLSNDSGSTWYWYDSGWVTTSESYSEANTSDEVNSNIPSFPRGEGEFLFKAFLSSSGSEMVELDMISLNFENDQSPPEILETEVETSATGAVISWLTDEDSSSMVEYGLTTDYGNSTPETDLSPRVSDHDVTISGLAPCTRYYYRVVSVDAFLNIETGDDDEFVTDGCTASSSIIAVVSQNVSHTLGGEIDLLNEGGQLILIIPSGFTDQSTNFQIKKISPEEVLDLLNMPPGNEFVGSHMYDLTALTGLSTLLVSFEEPITVKIIYNDDEAIGLDESTIKIFRWNGSAWSSLPDCLNDVENNTVECPTMQFSVFGLFGEEAATATPTPSPTQIVPTSTPLPTQSSPQPTASAPTQAVQPTSQSQVNAPSVTSALSESQPIIINSVPLESSTSVSETIIPSITQTGEPFSDPDLETRIGRSSEDPQEGDNNDIDVSKPENKLNYLLYAGVAMAIVALTYLIIKRRKQ